MKFEYTGNGNEAIFHPRTVRLEKKGQIVETEDPALIKVLEEHQSFKKAGATNKGGKK